MSLGIVKPMNINVLHIKALTIIYGKYYRSTS